MEPLQQLRNEVDRLRKWKDDHFIIHAALSVELALLQNRLQDVAEHCAQVPGLAEEVRKLTDAANSIRVSTEKQQENNRARETLRLSKLQWLVGLLGVLLVLANFIRGFL